VGLTNAAGTLVERYTYSAYGSLGIYAANGTVRTSSTYANRYTYTGREYDPDLNLYHFRARWYDPATGGFVTRDPLGYVDGVSLYRGYFELNGIDPSGKAYCKCIHSSWSSSIHGGLGRTWVTYHNAADCSSLNFLSTGASSGRSTSCAPSDGDVTNAYCRAAKAYPENGWFKCACHQSGKIDWAIRAMEYSILHGPAWLLGHDVGNDLHAKIDWFRCVRTCLSDKWKAGMTENQLNLPPTGMYWPICWKPCTFNSDDIGCCELQVYAEQAELQDCMGKCGAWRRGDAFPISSLPGWNGDFNDFVLRNAYAVGVCCGSTYYPHYFPNDDGLGPDIATTPLQGMSLEEEPIRLLPWLL